MNHTTDFRQNTMQKYYIVSMNSGKVVGQVKAYTKQEVEEKGYSEDYFIFTWDELCEYFKENEPRRNV